MDYNKKSLELHKSLKWKIETTLKSDIKDKNDLSIVYSPWVAEPCREIQKDESNAYKYTIKWNTIWVISDGSAVLWLWNIWAKASLPVMEWKCALFKKFGWVNAFPIVLDTQDTEEVIKTIKNIAPGLWWINLEDFSAPRCFEIEERLKNELDIPVFHDDQHWTAIVCLAWIINSLKLVNKDKQDVKVVINWVWAAWVAICKILINYWIKDIIIVDSRWIIYEWREWLNSTKEGLAKITNLQKVSGSLNDAMKWRDIFIWVSVWNLLNEEMIKLMANDPIIFALANPIPEILPEIAKKAWAKIIATWRSDYPNQINNVLVFPWIFKWALKNKVSKITDEMKINAALELANYVKNPTEEKIIPNPFEDWVSDIIANSVK